MSIRLTAEQSLAAEAAGRQQLDDKGDLAGRAAIAGAKAALTITMRDMAAAYAQMDLMDQHGRHIAHHMLKIASGEYP